MNKQTVYTYDNQGRQLSMTESKTDNSSFIPPSFAPTQQHQEKHIEHKSGGFSDGPGVQYFQTKLTLTEIRYKMDWFKADRFYDIM